MKRALAFIAGLIWSIALVAQTPTVVQDRHFPQSLGYGSATGWSTYPSNCGANSYCFQLPEPVAATGNLVVFGVFSGNTSHGTLTNTDNGDTCTDRVNYLDPNSNESELWTCASTAGSRNYKYVPSGTGGYIGGQITEFYNAAYDTGGCLGTGTASTSIKAASETPTVTGDYVWQFGEYNALSAPPSTTAFTASSQSNYAASLLHGSLNDAIPVEGGIYSSTAALQPTMTGASLSWTSCGLFLKGTASGGAGTQSPRIIAQIDEQINHASPQTMQIPVAANTLTVIGEVGLIDITGITGTVTFSQAGSSCIQSGVYNQVFYYYSTTAQVLSESVAYTGSNAGSGVIIQEFTGANATTPYDNYACQTGSQSSQATTLAACSSCFTPGHASDFVVGNLSINFCTNTAVTTTPSGGRFDPAYYTGNDINGPQSVDQNNGWFHLYPGSAATESVTWNTSCNQAAGGWNEIMVAFQSASSGSSVNQFSRVY